MDTNISVTVASIEAEYQSIITTQTTQLVAARAQVAALLSEREELRNALYEAQSAILVDDDSPED